MGYTSTEVKGKIDNVQQWYQIAIQFKGTNEKLDQISIVDAMKSSTGLTPSTWRNKGKTDGTGAPTLEKYNGQNYDYYYYISDVYPTLDDKKAKKNAQTGWANSDQLLATANYVKPGDALWFKADNLEGTATLTVAGEVIAGNTRTINVGEQGEWTAAANPFPIQLPIASIITTFSPSTWRNKGKADGTGAPTLEIYNGKNYDYYYYISDVYPTLDDKKAKKNALTGWSNSDQILATENMLNPGTGFWFKTTELGTGTITFTMPEIKDAE